MQERGKRLEIPGAPITDIYRPHSSPLDVNSQLLWNVCLVYEVSIIQIGSMLESK